jgi:hypothetical protein
VSQRFHVVEHESTFGAVDHETRDSGSQIARGALDFRRERRDVGDPRGGVRAFEGCAGVFGAKAAHRNVGFGERGDRLHPGGCTTEMERSKRRFCGLEIADQHEPANELEPGKRGIFSVARLLQDFRGSFEPSACRDQIATRERDLRLRGEAAGPTRRIARAELASCPGQELSRARKFSELCHGDATKRESGRIVAQRDSPQGSQRVEGGEGSGGRV